MELANKGWRPRRDVTPFIEWDPRASNTIADHAANVTLDEGDSWMQHEKTVEDTGLHIDSVNFHLRVDGARRGDSSSAAGMALMVHGADGKATILRRAGLLLKSSSSAFLAEMLAMEWALECFRDWYP